MAQRGRRNLVLAAAAALITAHAAGAADLKTLTKELFTVPSTTGSEDALAAKVRGLLPKGLTVEADGLGSIAVRVGGADGRTLVLAALDGYGHMVGGITPEGYLTLDRPVAPPHARFDGYLLGQPVIVTTAKGPVAGVVSQPAMHLLTPERRKLLVDGFSLETAFVDIGVRSEKEARAKGIERLDPVTTPAVWTELAGGRWAGPALGFKAAAAALAAAAADLTGGPGGEGAVLCWAAQTKFAARGRGARPAVGAARASTKWHPDRALIIDVIAADNGEGSPSTGGGPVLVVAKDGPSALRQAVEAAAAAAGTTLQVLVAPDSALALPFAAPPAEAATLALPVRYLNTPSEVVSESDLRALRDVLVRFVRPGGAK
jgi:putative aminopeptidase FrvX